MHYTYVHTCRMCFVARHIMVKWKKSFGGVRWQVKKGVEAAELEGSGESNNKARQACNPGHVARLPSVRTPQIVRSLGRQTCIGCDGM